MGMPAAALLRYSLGLGSLVLLTFHFPALTAGSQQALLGVTVLVGLSYGLAFGTSYQMASKFPPAATAALTTGAASPCMHARRGSHGARTGAVTAGQGGGGQPGGDRQAGLCS